MDTRPKSEVLPENERPVNKLSKQALRKLAGPHEYEPAELAFKILDRKRIQKINKNTLTPLPDGGQGSLSTTLGVTHLGAGRRTGNVPEYKVKFSLEHEQKAFEELKEHIQKMWEDKAPLYHQLQKENQEIRHYLVQNKIKLIQPEYEIEKSLLNKTMTEIVYSDPILGSILLFNSIEPEDLPTRVWIRNFLSEGKVSPYFSLLKIDLLKGNRLVKIHESVLSGVPLPLSMVGKIISGLLWDFEHFRCIDAVKEAGAEGSIEELRKNRLLQNEWGIVWDYSPLIRRKITKSGITVEVFREEDFRAARKDRNSFSNAVDAFLCFLIRQAGSDPRRDIFFGRTFPPTIRYVVRYQNQEISVALELWPKWKPRIEVEAQKYTLTNQPDARRDRSRDPWIKKPKRDENQEAMEGLFKGTRTWTKEKGPATNWLLKNIQWNLGSAFERLSTEDHVKIRLEWDVYEYFGGNKELARKWFQQRRLREKTEQSGGRLDKLATQEGETTKPLDRLTRRDFREKLEVEDNLPSEDSNALESILNKEHQKERRGYIDKILRENPKLREILEKEEKGDPLSDTERQTKHRAIKKAKEDKPH